MKTIYLAIVLLPLIAATIAGLGQRWVGRAGGHWLTILAVAGSFVLSCVVFKHAVIDGNVDNLSVYTWMVTGGLTIEVGFLVDALTAIMMVVVTFVSLMVHIYTVGYMHDDPGYTKFFSYISLFTFAMLMLVMSNNFMQLFFGWEAVGLVSYLLIGFWYKRETAIFANLKAFLVNRVGDFGFLLGIAAVLMYTGSLDYVEVFAAAPEVAQGAITTICLLLFVGAMGKSAQAPLHVWLPDSMEGPTPISALIHAATMVTAGIFMVARMSPLYELSEVALNVIIGVGAFTAFFMGLLGIVQNDIKRVVAYSTLSQLGYMFVALGVSAYAAGIFHLVTHAFFKALLFLAAGSVIIAMHHEQDIRKMGGLKRYMPITYWTALLGSLALIGFPGFSGFFSKDAIIEATHASTLAMAPVAYWAVLLGVFVTAFYSFRMFFLVFHGKERMDDHTREHLHETPWVVTVPLVALAIPSVIAGWIWIGPMLFGDFFGDAIFVSSAHDTLAGLREGWHGQWGFVLHGLMGWPTWLAAAGVFAAWFIYLRRPEIATRTAERFSWLYRFMLNKYGFDDFNQKYIAGGTRALGRGLFRFGDRGLIDGILIDGTAATIGRIAGALRRGQTGYLYHYAFVMIIGVVAIGVWMAMR